GPTMLIEFTPPRQLRCWAHARTRMVTELIAIIDRLLKLKEYRERRFRTFFNEVLEPTFNDLLIVHRDYIEMFEETYRLLPKGPHPISRIVRAPKKRKVQMKRPTFRGVIPAVETVGRPAPRAKIILATREECPEYFAQLGRALEYLEQKR